MNKKISVSVAITIAIIAMTVTFSVTMILAMQIFDNTVTSVNEKQSMYNKLSEIDKYVRANGYNEINDNTLYDYIAYGYMLGINDKNAKYYTEKEYSELLGIQSGKIMGIGVELIKDASTGYGRVVKVYTGSPAAELGIEVGSYITKIGETATKSLTRDAMLARLRGENGVTVNLTYLTPATNEEKTVDVNHYSYSAPTVDYQLVNEKLGYIRITQFGTTTTSELDYALNELVKQGAAALVFDLRDNEGGLLNTALESADLLCAGGPLAYAEYRGGTQEVLQEADDAKIDLPVVCLVNGNTASAAELFAASLRELNEAKLVGTKTHGKGTIQAAPQRLSDGSAVVVTVAKLLTGKGESFDGTGLAVDQEVTLAENTTLYDYTLEEDAQVQKALSVAVTLAGIGPSDSDSGSDASSDADSQPDGGDAGADEGSDTGSDAGGEG